MDVSIPNFLRKRAELSPNKIAIETDSEKITFLKLLRKSENLARKMASLSIKKGDIVSVFMSNSIAQVEVIFALKHIGCITVLHNTRLTPAELHYQIKDAGSKIAFSDEEKLELFSHIKLNETSVMTIQTLKIAKEDSTICLQKEFCMSETDTIMYTSGTTGNPKGVKQTYGNHYWSASSSALNLGLYEEDCWLAAVPLFHISGLSIIMRGVIYGMRVVLHTKFEPKKVNKAIRENHVTIVSVVSSMLVGLLDDLGEREYPNSLRCLLVGGGPVPISLLEKCREKKIPVVQTYGMTETCSQIVTLSSDDAIKKVGSAGKPLFPCQMKIMKDGKELGANMDGEIVVKGPNVSPGYWKFENSILQNGWFHTGDIGYIDEDGYLFVLDRRSDLIISGGENIYPAEIENVLVSHEGITEAGVTGLRDEKWGHVPVGFVVLQKGAVLTENDILHFVSGRMAKYKVPKRIVFIKELPKNATNKLLRRKLIELLPGKE
ncbi:MULTISPECIES: o-succinylbenzoate--CoA ligase [Bacillus]|uniref:o-succinylbenzoate--CoA ligase n=1 Tax=Bacillus TaxID=1386 RepID=UPI000BB949D9|nr:MULTISPECIES: o-succinylbenzoate--CoA ligase [Bacillus]